MWDSCWSLKLNVSVYKEVKFLFELLRFYSYIYQIPFSLNQCYNLILCSKHRLFSKFICNRKMFEFMYYYIFRVYLWQKNIEYRRTLYDTWHFIIDLILPTCKVNWILCKVVIYSHIAMGRLLRSTKM